MHPCAQLPFCKLKTMDPFAFDSFILQFAHALPHFGCEIGAYTLKMNLDT